MNNTEFVQRMRDFSIDHEPQGWPAIKMEQITRLCDIIDGMIPALDLLQTRLESGATICYQSKEWYLLDESGDVITFGKTLNVLLVNLIMVEC